MADTTGHASTRSSGWRWLGVFWLVVLSLGAIGAGVLQWLGPPTEAPLAASTHKAVSAAHGDPPAQSGAGRSSVGGNEPVPPMVATRDTPGVITDPDPALLEPVSKGSKANLPRVTSDGRAAMRVYAAGFDHSSHRPRVGLLLAGIGMNEVESGAAIRTLPSGISLAVSPYAAANEQSLPKLLATARATGHEYLIALPLEPAGFPLNDPGPATLLTSAPPAANAEKLHWVLSRFDGYVGVTGVVGTMRGERFAAMTDQMEAVTSELAGRGLLYIDPREGHGPLPMVWGRHADLVIDDPADQGTADRTMIDTRLAVLEQTAKDTGSALGLVMRPTPVAVARLAAWSNGLADRGLALVPVSALALPPADNPEKLSEQEQ